MASHIASPRGGSVFVGIVSRSVSQSCTPPAGVTVQIKIGPLKQGLTQTAVVRRILGIDLFRGKQGKSTKRA